MEKREPSNTAGGHKLVQSLWKTILRFLKNLKIELPYDPTIPFLGTQPEKTKTLFHKDTHSPMFTAVLFITAKTWKQIECPSTDKWIRKM